MIEFFIFTTLFYFLLVGAHDIGRAKGFREGAVVSQAWKQQQLDKIEALMALSDQWAKNHEQHTKKDT